MRSASSSVRGYPRDYNINNSWHGSTRVIMSDSKGKRRRFVSLPSQDNITVFEHPGATGSSSTSRNDDQHGPSTDIASSKSRPTSPVIIPAGEGGRLHRGLSTRQVQMIAIAGKGSSSVPAKVYSNGLTTRGS